MNDSLELLRALKNAGYPKSARDPFWWPRSGTFWVVVGAILTQQAKWEKVEKVLNIWKHAASIVWILWLDSRLKL